MSMCLEIWSGGQTGVDEAALRAAQAAGLVTGGWMPYGWKTEAGPRPEFRERYGMQEMPLLLAGYPKRTLANVRDTDATLVLVPGGGALEGGTAATVKVCKVQGRAWLAVPLDDPGTYGWVAAWIRWHAKPPGEGAIFRAPRLNVAGPRESKSPGLGARAEAYLSRLFVHLKGDCGGE